MYSRRATVEEKENRRKAFGFGLLSIAIIAFMAYFGLPLLAKVSSFTYDLRRTGEPVEGSDKTPPPPPSIDEIPSFTNKMNIDVTGNSEAGVTIIFQINNSREEVVTNAEGGFTKSIPLNDGANTLLAYAQDTAGNKSVETREYQITFDNEKPELVILSPKDGDEFYGQKEKQLNVKGTTEKDAQVQINGRFVIVNSDGSFDYTIGLNDGENALAIKSTDAAGNETEETLTVRFSP
jgi:hypothetical protein